MIELLWLVLNLLFIIMCGRKGDHSRTIKAYNLGDDHMMHLVTPFPVMGRRVFVAVEHILVFGKPY